MKILVFPNLSGDDFASVVTALNKIETIRFLEKIDDFDMLFWHFNYSDSEFILHLTQDNEIEIYSAKCNNAEVKNDEDLYKLSAELGIQYSVFISNEEQEN